MSAATANLSTAAAAIRLCARTADVNGCKNIVLQRGAAVRAPVRAARHPALVVRCNQNNDWPAPAAPPLGEVSSSLQNNQQPRGHLSTERRDLRQRAAEIANIDPNDPRSLDLIGSKTPCKVQFNIPFDTKMGEEVMIIGSHEKLGAWDQANACAMEWSDGGVWRANLELPAGGVFFYKYVVKTLDQGFKWQEGANNLLVLPEPWDIPEGSVFMVDDSFSGLSRSSQNQLAVKLISCEKAIVQLKMETHKAKEMTKASLQELLNTREELSEANQKLEHYERNVQTVISSMQQQQSIQNQQSRAR